jgi:hypothetical protein
MLLDDQRHDTLPGHQHPMTKGLRPSELSRLRALLADQPRGLSIVSISGPGGVGKSYFLREALEGVDVATTGTIVLGTDAASPQARGELFTLLDGLFRRSLPPPADPRRDYFPRLREVAGYHRELERSLLAELRQADPRRPEDTLVALLRAGRVLNAHLPFPVGMAVQAIGEPEIRALVRAARAMQERTALPGPLRDLLGVTRQNRVRSDLYRLVAEELRGDLSAAIGGYERRDRIRITQRRIPGARRLALVIDDYEAVGPLLGDFLVGALVPELAAAPFDTALVIVGRDDLEATHPGWAQHAKAYQREAIRLAPFDRAAAFALLAEAGLPEERRAPLFELTQGYPFLLTLALEEAAADGAESALFLRKFFDRTTRWMTPTEQEWFTRICYLDTVNEDTLARVFPADQAPRIQDWFEHEASIRDPAAALFRVRPLIREKVLRYLERRAPSRHAELLALARGAAPP